MDLRPEIQRGLHGFHPLRTNPKRIVTTMAVFDYFGGLFGKVRNLTEAGLPSNKTEIFWLVPFIKNRSVTLLAGQTLYLSKMGCWLKPGPISLTAGKVDKRQRDGH